jgi:membrane protein YqaA with SNARE-associated domain
LFKHLTDTLIAWGPAGILFLSILDSSGFPVAGVFDALLILLAVRRPEVAWLCAGLAVAGSTVGNSLLFFAAREGGRGFMTRLTPEGRAAKFREWFRQYGMITVFVPALVPIPMPLKLFVVSAGVMGTSWAEFTSVVLAARILRYFGEAWLGMTLGRESASFLKAHAGHFALGAGALGGGLYLFVLLRQRRGIRRRGGSGL